jgi:hypothetical protein
MQQSQDVQDDLIQIYGAPRALALANEMMDALDDVPRSSRIGGDIIEQLFEHWDVGQTLRQKSFPGRGVACDGGERLVELVGKRCC